ncbi:hypothetical protein Dsin_029248 [Dipteronia sinensis]|uniref:Uncharacterized protein n=1 Tax=Dipteronia sinensis TaxID=43782 RepID=A0AAE0DWB3_9ROSI|nr:hypothetical protein Dsin_029248 [Dipteronia sinensis]
MMNNLNVVRDQKGLPPGADQDQGGNHVEDGRSLRDFSMLRAAKTCHPSAVRQLQPTLLRLSRRYNEVSEDLIKLKLFPFSLRDKAKAWLQLLPTDSIIIWDQLA